MTTEACRIISSQVYPLCRQQLTTVMKTDALERRLQAERTRGYYTAFIDPECGCTDCDENGVCVCVYVCVYVCV